MQPLQKKLSVKLAKNSRTNIWSVKVGVHRLVLELKSHKEQVQGLMALLLQRPARIRYKTCKRSSAILSRGTFTVKLAPAWTDSDLSNLECKYFIFKICANPSLCLCFIVVLFKMQFNYKPKKRRCCAWYEPGDTGRQVQTDPLSYGGHSAESIVSKHFEKYLV